MGMPPGCRSSASGSRCWSRPRRRAVLRRAAASSPATRSSSAACSWPIAAGLPSDRPTSARSSAGPRLPRRERLRQAHARRHRAGPHAPAPVKRVHELIDWVRSARYDRIILRSTSRRGQEPDLGARPTPRRPHYTERFKALLDEAAQGVSRLGEGSTTHHQAATRPRSSRSGAQGPLVTYRISTTASFPSCCHRVGRRIRVAFAAAGSPRSARRASRRSGGRHPTAALHEGRDRRRLCWPASRELPVPVSATSRTATTTNPEAVAAYVAGASRRRHRHRGQLGRKLSSHQFAHGEGRGD